MKILGIDPGTARLGWGIIKYQNNQFQVLNFGCIETSSKISDARRLKKIAK